MNNVSIDWLSGIIAAIVSLAVSIITNTIYYLVNKYKHQPVWEKKGHDNRDEFIAHSSKERVHSLLQSALKIEKQAKDSNSNLNMKDIMELLESTLKNSN